MTCIKALLGGATVAGLIGTTLALGSVAPASATPSWSDVKAAKASQSAAQAKVDEIDTALDKLQTTADSAQITQQESAQAYSAALTKQEAAQSDLDELKAQSKRAKSKAAASAKRVAGLVVELSRSGSGDLSTSLLTDSGDASDLLYKVGTMSHLSERSAAVLAEAQADQRQVKSIKAQAAVATTALSKATATTKSALANANDVSANASARLAKAEKQQTTLLSELAYLKGTTVATETAYWNAQQAKAAEAKLAATAAASSNASKRAASSATASSSASSDTTAASRSASSASASTGGTSSSSGSASSRSSTSASSGSSSSTASGSSSSGSTSSSTGTSTSSGTTTSTSKAAAVLAYARAQVGKPYLLGASGPSAFDCSGLVQAAYNSVGVATGAHNVVSQYYYFQSLGRLVPLSQAEPGDILFYSDNGSASGGYHDTIYAGNGTMIEAANPSVGVVERAVWGQSQLLGYVARPTGAL